MGGTDPTWRRTSGQLSVHPQAAEQLGDRENQDKGGCPHLEMNGVGEEQLQLRVRWIVFATEHPDCDSDERACQHGSRKDE
jgi:hypothetical protein